MKINDIDRSNPHTMTGGRAHGATFRRLCEAMEQASAGNHVYYIVNNGRMVEWTYNKAGGMCYEFFGGSVLEKGRKHTVLFPSGGFVSFISEEIWNRNPVPSDVTTTHTVIEMDDTHPC